MPTGHHTPPPPPACRQCYAPIAARWQRCRGCEASARWRAERGLDPLPVHVIDHAPLGSPLHERMRWYKDAAQPQARHELTLRVAGRLSEWLSSHPEVLEEVDLVTCVPSRRRAPMEPVVDAIPTVVSRHRRLVMPVADLGRDHDPGAFDVDTSADGRRVLVIDDAFVSGATVLSAADALTRAGAEVTGVVVLVRLHHASGTPAEAA